MIYGPDWNIASIFRHFSSLFRGLKTNGTKTYAKCRGPAGAFEQKPTVMKQKSCSKPLVSVQFSPHFSKIPLSPNRLSPGIIRPGISAKVYVIGFYQTLGFDDRHEIR